MGDNLRQGEEGKEPLEPSGNEKHGFSGIPCVIPEKCRRRTVKLPAFSPPPGLTVVARAPRKTPAPMPRPERPSRGASTIRDPPALRRGEVIHQGLAKGLG